MRKWGNGSKRKGQSSRPSSFEWPRFKIGEIVAIETALRRLGGVKTNFSIQQILILATVGFILISASIIALNQLAPQLSAQLLWGGLCAWAGYLVYLAYKASLGIRASKLILSAGLSISATLVAAGIGGGLDSVYFSSTPFLFIVDPRPNFRLVGLGLTFGIIVVYLWTSPKLQIGGAPWE